MVTALVLSLLAGPALVDLPVPQDEPPIELSINNDRRFRPGDDVKVKVRSKDDGYLLVLHADPDGRVRVLFPLDPGDDNFVRGGRKQFEVRGRGDRETFQANMAGQGMVYAAVSRDPFRFDRYILGDHWDYRTLAPERLPREPEAELTELVQGMAQGGFDYDVLSYDVNERAYTVYQPGYRHWNWGGVCDPFYYDHYCQPYSRSFLSIRLNFGRPYRGYYYDPFYYDPFFYRPVYGYPHRYAGYYPGRPIYVGGRYPNRGIVRGYVGDNYRDRRYTFRDIDRAPALGAVPRRTVATPAAPARGAVTRTQAQPEARRVRPNIERRPAESKQPAEGRRVRERERAPEAEGRAAPRENPQPRAEPRRRVEESDNSGGRSVERRGGESRSSGADRSGGSRSNGGGRRQR